MDKKDTRDILNLVKTNATTNDPTLSIDDYNFDKGLTYDWSQRREFFPRETPHDDARRRRDLARGGDIELERQHKLGTLHRPSGGRTRCN